MITSDQTPEIGEVSRITLTSIIDNGVPEGGDQSKGASITSSRAVAVVTINANDNPFGSVAWSDFGGIVTGMERDSDSTVSLSVVRTLGTHGDIGITYRLMMIIITTSSHLIVMVTVLSRIAFSIQVQVLRAIFNCFESFKMTCTYM